MSIKRFLHIAARIVLSISIVTSTSARSESAQNNFQYSQRPSEANSSNQTSQGPVGQPNPDVENRRRQEAEHARGLQRDHEKTQELRGQASESVHDLLQKLGPQVFNPSQPGAPPAATLRDEAIQRGPVSQRTDDMVLRPEDQLLNLNTLPTFASAALEQQKQRAVGLLEDAYVAQDRQLEGKSLAWTRADLLLIQAAKVASQKGDEARANELLKQAQHIGALLAAKDQGSTLVLRGSSGSDLIIAEDGQTPSGTTLMERTEEEVTQAAVNTFLNEVRPDWAQALNPNGELNSLRTLYALESSLESQSKISNDEKTVLDLTKKVLDRTLTMATSPQATRIALEVAWLGVDILIALNPVTSVTRDLIELAFGRNYRTAQTLSLTERALALVSLILVSQGNAIYRVLSDISAIKILVAEARDLRQVIQSAEELSASLKEAHAFNADFVRSIRPLVFEAKDAAKQLEIINDTTRTARARAAAAGIDAEVVGYIKGSFANELEWAKKIVDLDKSRKLTIEEAQRLLSLNQKGKLLDGKTKQLVEKVLQWQASHVGEDHILVMNLNSPHGILPVRLHGPDNQVGIYFVLKQQVQGLTPIEFQQILNTKEIPTLYSVPRLRKADQIWMSLAEKNGFGKESGHLQFKIDSLEDYHYTQAPRPLPLDKNGRIDFSLERK